MNHLYLFLRRVLIVFLVSTFTFVSSFTGKAIAQPDPHVLKPFVDVCTLRRPNGSIVSQPEFQNPPFADADKGPVTLRAAQAQFELEGNGKEPGKKYDGYVYKAKYTDRHNQETPQEYINYTPPVIEVSPSHEDGEDNVLNLTLINDLPVNVQLPGELPPTKENLENQSQYTNIHYHGFNVSPLLGGDDVLVDVPSNVTPDPNSSNGFINNGGYYPNDFPDSTHGSIAEYKMNFLIPDIHQSGLFWYHSHAHSMSNNQVRAGLSGGIIIKGNEEYYDQFNPPIELPDGEPSLARTIEEPIFPANSLTPEIDQKVMLFKDFNDVLDSGNTEDCLVLNSQVNPKITIRPGEIQLWRVANIGAETYMNIALEKINPNNELHAQNLQIAEGSEVVVTFQSDDGPITATLTGPDNSGSGGDSEHTITLTQERGIVSGSVENLNIEIEEEDVAVESEHSISNVVIESADLDSIEIETSQPPGTMTTITSVTGTITSGSIKAIVDNELNNTGVIEETGTAQISGSIQGDSEEIPEFTKPWGNSNFYILARDSDVVAHPVATDSILLPPAVRAEFLVVGGRAGQEYNLVSDLSTGLTEGEHWVHNFLKKTYLLATVKVEEEEEIETYTYKEDESTISVCDADVEESTHTCTGGNTQGHTDLDFFIKNQAPYKIDKILPPPEILASLDDFAPQRTDQALRDKMFTDHMIRNIKSSFGCDPNSDAKHCPQMDGFLGKIRLTQSNEYENEPLTKNRYFYFTNDGTKFFMEGFPSDQPGPYDRRKIGDLFDGNRIDKVSKVDDIEEWNLVNPTNNAHVFHIHQLDFIVTKVILDKDPCDGLDGDDTCTYNNYTVKYNNEENHNCDGLDGDDTCTYNNYTVKYNNEENHNNEENLFCQKVGWPTEQGTYPELGDTLYQRRGFQCNLETQGYRDVINLPPHSTTTIRIPFVNPFITGIFVYHCHILNHEDRGMMQNLKVINPKTFRETRALQETNMNFMKLWKLLDSPLPSPGDS